MKNRGGRSAAKDFVVLWAQKYKEKTGNNYYISWTVEASIFRNLMSELTNKQIREIIDFAFSDHKATTFLRDNGYPIRLLPSQVNSFLPHLDSTNSPELDIDPNDLYLEIPYWEDQRVAYIYRCIARSDLNVLIDNIPPEEEYPWKLLMAKMKKQDGLIRDKVILYYKMWKQRDKIERARICKK